MSVKSASGDFNIQYATRVFKVAKSAMKMQGEQTLKLIDSAQSVDSQRTAQVRPGRGRLINVVA